METTIGLIRVLLGLYWGYIRVIIGALSLQIHDSTFHVLFDANPKP